MSPHNDVGLPAANEKAHPAPHNDAFSIDDRMHKSTHPDGPWQANFRRMAERAAVDPDFYAIAGRGVQALADDIRAGVA